MTKFKIAIYRFVHEQGFNKLVEALEIGQKMRKTQKQYFKTRNQSFLIKSKELEKQFDNIIKEIESYENK